MTERQQEIRTALRILNSLSDEEWETLEAMTHQAVTEERVEALLNEMTVPHYKGRLYIKAAIVMLKQQSKERAKIIFSKIAQTYGVSVKSVNGCISYAIERSNAFKVKKLLGFERKPSNEQFISQCAEYLK